MIIIFLLLIGGGVAYYLFNKKPEKVEDMQSKAITAEELYKAFSTEEANANKLYLSKVFDVTGKVQEVNTNQDGQTVLILGVEEDPLSGVQCTLREAKVKPEIGSTITVTGFCNGYTMVVILSDCIIK